MHAPGVPALVRRTPLKRGKSRLKTRPFRERREDCYGPLWEAVKREPCVGLRWFPGRHRCEGRHTSHHDPPRGRGGTDDTGQLPCCELIHAPLDNRSLRETRSELLARVPITEEQLREQAMAYVEGARARIEGVDLAL